MVAPCRGRHARLRSSRGRPIGRPMASQAHSAQDNLGRLDECDANLALVATEVTGLQAELDRFHSDVEILRRHLSEQETTLAEREAALARVTDDKARLQREAGEAHAAVQQAIARLRAQDDSIAALEGELAALRARAEVHGRSHAAGEDALAASERDRVRAQQRAEEAWSALDASSRRLREREARVAELEEEVHALRLRLAAERDQQVVQSAPEPQLDSSAGHLRVVPLEFGHLLLESDDPCPALSAVVELDGTTFVVDRVGRSPLPGDRRPCVFLVER
jgi:chromosome segregation ATPase